MIKNYLHTALRNLLKNKISSMVNLMCLSVGMACCILIAIYIKDELSYNKHHANYDKIYRINWISKYNGQTNLSATTPISLGKTIKEQMPQMQSLTQLYQRSGGMLVKEGEEVKKFQEQRVYFADNNLFKVFTIPFVKGNPKNIFSEPNTVVLTDEMAVKYFGDENAIGKTILYDNKVPLMVKGVIKKMPATSDLQADFLISFESLYSAEAPDIAEFLRTDWTFNPVYAYTLLEQGTDTGRLNKSLTHLLYKHGNERNKTLNRIYVQPLHEEHLYSSEIRGNLSNNSITYIYIFAAIALLILLIASVNFINLANARASIRAREVGMRKVLGASMKQLMVQFMSETWLLSIFSFVLALLIAQLTLPVLNSLTQKNLEWSSWFTLTNVVLFVFMFFVTGTLAGVYPAFFITRFNTILSLKGKSGSTSQKNTLSQLLMVTQFVITMVLISATFIIYQQLEYLRNKPLGFQKENILSVPIFGSGASPINFGVDGSIRQRMNAFSEELTKFNKIKAVTAASSLPGPGYIPGLVIPEGFTEQDNIFIPWVSVDYNFISTMQIPLVAGRDFSKSTGSDHLSAFIISESAVKRFGWKSPEDALGRKLIRGQQENGKQGEIIGVVKDHQFSSLDVPSEPLIMDVHVPRFTQFAISIEPGNTPATIAYIKEKWDNFFPERVFEYSFMDADINNMYSDRERLGKTIGNFAMVAVLLSCLGLFSLASFLTLQRTKEIGIRKVMGAGVSRILLLLSYDFLKLVIVAILIATPISWYTMNRWLEGYANRIEIGWWVFVTAGVFTLLTAWLTISFQTIKAASENPIKSLRME